MLPFSFSFLFRMTNKILIFFVLNFLSTILLTELADCNPKCIKVCMYVCIYTNKAGTLIQKYCGTLFLNFYLLFFFYFIVISCNVQNNSITLFLKVIK